MCSFGRNRFSEFWNKLTVGAKPIWLTGIKDQSKELGNSSSLTSSRVVWMTSVKSCDRDRARPSSQVSHCKRAKYLAGVPTRNETLIK